MIFHYNDEKAFNVTKGCISKVNLGIRILRTYWQSILFLKKKIWKQINPQAYKSKYLSTVWTDLNGKCVHKVSILNVPMLLTELMHEIAQSQALRQPRQLYIKDTFQHYTWQINDTRYTQQAVNTYNQKFPLSLLLRILSLFSTLL